MTKRSIQSLGTQEVDVTVIPADLFRQDLSNPADPILDFQDRAIRARRLESPNILATERVETPLVSATERVETPLVSATERVETPLVEAETLVSTAPTGTTPLILTSTTKVNNLNADMLDGYHAGNASGNVPISNGTINTNLNADLHDGYHAGNASGQVPISNGTVNTNLVAEKAVKQTLSTVSANTALDSNACIIEVTTADAVTLTIPSGLSIGHQYCIKRTVASANGISVITSGSETVEGGTSFTVQGSKVSATLDTGEVVLEKVSSTAWAFVGGQISGSNSNGTWIKFSDGTMICQIGFTAVSGGATNYVSLPKKFIVDGVNFNATSVSVTKSQAPHVATGGYFDVWMEGSTGDFIAYRSQYAQPSYVAVIGRCK
jgi:hypothetical protein